MSRRGLFRRKDPSAPLAKPGTSPTPSSSATPSPPQPSKVAQIAKLAQQDVKVGPDPYEVKQGKQAVVLLVGATGSGKSTFVQNLFQRRYDPDDMPSLYSDTEHPIVHLCRVKDTKGMDQKVVSLVLIDTPGLREVRRNTEVSRDDGTILASINSLLEREIAGISCVCLFLRFPVRLLDADVDVMVQFINQFTAKDGGLSPHVRLILSQADKEKPSHVTQVLSQLRSHDQLKDFIESPGVRIMPTGLYRKGHTPPELEATVAGWRNDILADLMSCGEAVPLQDLPVIQEKTTQMRSCLEAIARRMSSIARSSDPSKQDDEIRHLMEAQKQVRNNFAFLKFGDLQEAYSAALNASAELATCPLLTVSQRKAFCGPFWPFAEDGDAAGCDVPVALLHVHNLGLGLCTLKPWKAAPPIVNPLSARGADHPVMRAGRILETNVFTKKVRSTIEYNTVPSKPSTKGQQGMRGKRKGRKGKEDHEDTESESGPTPSLVVAYTPADKDDNGHTLAELLFYGVGAPELCMVPTSQLVLRTLRPSGLQCALTIEVGHTSSCVSVWTQIAYGARPLACLTVPHGTATIDAALISDAEDQARTHDVVLDETQRVQLRQWWDKHGRVAAQKDHQADPETVELKGEVMVSLSPTEPCEALLCTVERSQKTVSLLYGQGTEEFPTLLKAVRTVVASANCGDEVWNTVVLIGYQEGADAGLPKGMSQRLATELRPIAGHNVHVQLANAWGDGVYKRVHKDTAPLVSSSKDIERPPFPWISKETFEASEPHMPNPEQVVEGDIDVLVSPRSSEPSPAQPSPATVRRISDKKRRDFARVAVAGHGEAKARDRADKGKRDVDDDPLVDADDFPICPDCNHQMTSPICSTCASNTAIVPPAARTSLDFQYRDDNLGDDVKCVHCKSAAWEPLASVCTKINESRLCCRKCVLNERMQVKLDEIDALQCGCSAKEFTQLEHRLERVSEDVRVQVEKVMVLCPHRTRGCKKAFTRTEMMEHERTCKSHAKESSLVLGIDLGTTYSAAAVVVDGKPEVILVDGHATIPSVLCYVYGSSQPLVGHDADSAAAQVLGATSLSVDALDESDRAVLFYDGKRVIGTQWDPDRLIGNERVKYPFEWVKGSNEAYCLEAHGIRVAPEVMAKHILHRLKVAATQQLGVPITKAVISVPAHFGQTQRIATRVAGQLAGLDVVNLVPEPTAAAWMYAFAHGAEIEHYDSSDNSSDEEGESDDGFDDDEGDSGDGKSSLEGSTYPSATESEYETESSDDGDNFMVVFDLGGGTLDVTVLTYETNFSEYKNAFCNGRVVGIGGDPFLGGRDWDSCLMRGVLNELNMDYDTLVNESKGRSKLEQLRRACKWAKERLSAEDNVDMDVTFLGGNARKFTVTRELLTNCSRQLVEQAMDVVKTTLASVPKQRVSKVDHGLKVRNGVAYVSSGGIGAPTLANNEQLTCQDVKRVLLVGGSSRLHCIREQLEELFSQDRIRSEGKLKAGRIPFNADLCVAQGASLVMVDARLARIQETVSTIDDVLPKALGIMVTSTSGVGEWPLRIFPQFYPANSTIPRCVKFNATRSKEYKIHLVSGDDNAFGKTAQGTVSVLSHHLFKAAPNKRLVVEFTVVNGDLIAKASIGLRKKIYGKSAKGTDASVQRSGLNPVGEDPLRLTHVFAFEDSFNEEGKDPVAAIRLTALLPAKVRARDVVRFVVQLDDVRVPMLDIPCIRGREATMYVPHATQSATLRYRVKLETRTGSSQEWSPLIRMAPAIPPDASGVGARARRRIQKLSKALAARATIIAQLFDGSWPGNEWFLDFAVRNHLDGKVLKARRNR